MKRKQTELRQVKRIGLAAMLALGGAAGVQAAGSNTVDLHASLQIGAPQNCSVNVTSPSGGAMTAKWDKGEDAGNSSLTVTSTTPPSVTVTSTGGTSCSLNNLKVSTYMQGNDSAGAEESYAMIRTFTREAGGDGSWRFIPYIAQAKFFKSTDAMTGQAPYDKVTYDAPGSDVSDLDQVQFQDEATYHAGELIASFPDTREYKFLTEHYVAAGAAIQVYKGEHTGSFNIPSPELYQSAVLSFGALLATDPDDDSGQADRTKGPDNNLLDIGWTVTLTPS